jgi:hypothetical protein
MPVIRRLFTPWTVLGAFVIGLLLIGAAALYLTNTRQEQAIPGVPTAELAIILAPTPTSPIPTAPPATPTPAAADLPTPLPGTLSIGTLVQITGTGGEGLNLRAEPGLGTGIEYLGFESEVFTVTDGPADADGLVWWYIGGFSDEARAGWAASNFLEIVQSP